MFHNPAELASLSFTYTHTHMCTTLDQYINLINLNLI